jgi:phosphopantetheinyl transferase
MSPQSRATIESVLNPWLASVTGSSEPMVVMAQASSPVELSELTFGELIQFQTITHPRRQHSWRLGRSALKTVLPPLQRSADSSVLSWPDPTVSLSHTDDHAMAIGLLLPPKKRRRTATRGARGSLSIVGIGIDLEPLERTPSPRLVKHFLNPTELTAWQALSWPNEIDASYEALRLWTVKEAVWKSCPGNASIPLNQISLHQLEPFRGTASLGEDDRQWIAHYFTMTWKGHWVTVAVCLAGA